MASEMPVLPLVGSSSARPGSSSPEASAASIIAFATRSLIEPVGFWPSSLAHTRTASGTPVACASRRSSTSGVPPTRSRRDSAAVGLRTSPCHGRQEDERRVLADRRLEAVEGADVLALEEDVDERRDLAAAEDA